MFSKSKAPSLKWHWKKLFNYFLQGIIIVAPIIITVWAVLSLFVFVDNILPNILRAILPESTWRHLIGDRETIPGLGFILVIALFVLVGWVSSYFVVGKLVSILDRVLEHTPGIKFIYSSVKDFLEAFAGNKRKFDKPVLVNVDGIDVWRMGFITQKDCVRFALADHVAVYVPHSYALSGIVYIVPTEKVKILPHTTPADAMKFAVSGGVSDVAE
ncbi:MAG: transporter [Segetibacter sp.]|nr:transporter [Segetibacter sp.]